MVRGVYERSMCWSVIVCGGCGRRVSVCEHLCMQAVGASLHALFARLPALLSVTDHDRDGHGLDDLLDHLGVGHACDAALYADVSGHALERHDGAGARLLCDACLLDVDDVLRVRVRGGWRGGELRGWVSMCLARLPLVASASEHPRCHATHHDDAALEHLCEAALDAKGAEVAGLCLVGASGGAGDDAALVSGCDAVGGRCAGGGGAAGGDDGGVLGGHGGGGGGG